MQRVVSDGGTKELGARVLQNLLRRLDLPEGHLEVRPADVLAADLGATRSVDRLPLEPGGRMQLNWVTTPPGRGSGGHTTAFRLIRYLESRGHTCRVYLYDIYGGDARYYGPEIQEMFPDLRATVHDVDDGLADAHATFATSWPTAYPVLNQRMRGGRAYLVQDFEPWFYPVGSSSALAENTYRMGFHAITAGPWLSRKLADEYGMDADPFEFGCDTERYHLKGTGRRNGIVFYARPGAPRRAFEIGMMALQLFAEAHPDVDIHLYGHHVGHLPFRAVDHGLITPDELNDIYNVCSAGLSLSMTNVSLVPHEMLAAGCIPVVNDAEHNRMVLDNPLVRYALPTPLALAAALGEIVAAGDHAAVAERASLGVRSASWEDAGSTVEQALYRWLAP